MSDLIHLMEETWPPAQRVQAGAFALRWGLGGGQRVSCATVAGDWNLDDLIRAEEGMRSMGQAPLFMLVPEDAALDVALEARGYAIKDPVVMFSATARDVAGQGPAPMTSFPHWPPLSIARSLWDEGHIGPTRVEIMARAAGPKAAVLGRSDDRAAGVAFVAIAGGVGFVHALHVAPAMRRRGCAANLMRAAAVWAQGQGAARLALAVTAANAPACALYTSLGMQIMGRYHYRVLAA